MLNKHFFFIALIVFYTSVASSAEKLSKREIKEYFKNKTVEGLHLKKNFSFVRFYGKDGELVQVRDGRSNIQGHWKASWGGLCHQWIKRGRKRKRKCNIVKKEGEVLKLYNRSGQVPVILFKRFTLGNNLEKADSLLSSSNEYVGPMIDGHGHLGGNYDPAYMVQRNKRDNISKMVVFPRLFRAATSSATTEKTASKVAKKYKDHIWMTVGLQRKDLFAMNWHKPSKWWQRWLKWARKEILSGRRRGMGELTARHHAYTNSDFAERDKPIDSKVVNDLLKLSAETKRPLVLHAEGEPHVVKAIKTQLKRHPKAILVWAHACGRSSPNLVATLLNTYSNLYCDLGNMTDTGNYGSFWPRKEKWMWQWEKEGTILPKWKKLMELHPDRFYLGMDSNQWRAWQKNGIRSRRGRINRFRAVLPQLSKKTIKSITILVPTRLFGDR